MSATERAAAAPSSGTGASGILVVRHPGLLKAVTMLATLMQVLDMTIANVALPHMQASLGANQDSISWVLTSYIVASAIALPITGWLSDRVGQRSLYLWSVGGFVMASILCGVAGNLEEMVLFRILQGVSGAFLTPLAQTVLLDITPTEKRGQAMALFGMGVVIGPVLGPILGGWLTESMNWRWVFFVNVPIGAIAFSGLWFLLPDIRKPARSLDLFGFVLLAAGLASFQLMLDRGQHADWFNSAEIWIETLVAVSALWMFGVHVLTARNPLYSGDLLGNRNLVIGALLMGALGMILTASMALMPIMLEDLFDYPVLNAGFLLSTRGVGVMLMMGTAGKLVTKFDPRLLIGIGFLIVIFAFWEMTYWNTDVSWGSMALNGFLQGMGMGLLFVPITTMAFATLPAHVRTDGSGILNLARSLGSSASISIVVALLARNSAISHADLAASLTPASLGFDPYSYAYATSLVESGLSLLNGEVTRQAMMIAFLDDFYFMMLVSICALPLTLLVKKPSASDGAPEIPVME
ncbi:MAG: DHA2 family efflux MFS transporter permease subunit [Sphingobium sp.]